jgi:hypothetical protein
MTNYNSNHYDKKLSSSQVLLIVLGMIILAGLLFLKLSGMISL